MMIEDEELRNLYKISSAEHLQKLEDGLRDLQKHPDDEAILEELRREAHSLKGDSRSVGVESVETIIYRIETILLSIKRQQIVLTPELSDRLYQGLDAIHLLVQEAVTGEGSGVDITEIVNDLIVSVSPVEELQPEIPPDNSNTSGVVLTFIADDELRNLYKRSSEERLQKLEAGLRNLEKHPDDEAILEELQREVHSLRGDSRSVGVESVETFADCLAEIFVSIKSQQTVLSPQLSDRLYQGLAAIGFLVGEAVTGELSGVDTAEIFNELMVTALEPQELQSESPPENGVVSVTGLSCIADEELRNLYQISSEERLRKLEEGLQYLQTHPHDESTIEELRREVHSLKGDSRSVGVESVEIIARCLEEILSNISRQQIILTPQLSDRLDQGLVAIGFLVAEAVTGQASGVNPTEILNQLMEAVSEVEESQPKTASTFIEDEELREVYKISSQDRLQKLEVGLLHLEKHPNDTVNLEKLLREAHSLKGDSRSVGLETVETLTHQFEEILGSIKSQQILLTPLLSDLLYQGLDAVSLLVQEAVTGQPSQVDTTTIVERLIELGSAPSVEEIPDKNAFVPVIPIPELPSVGEPYRIDTIRVETKDLDALMAQSDELTVTRISIAHATAAIEEMTILWQEWKAFYRQRQSPHSSSLGINPYEERLEKAVESLRNLAEENTTKLDIIAGELGEKIRTLRLLPLSTVFQLFPRMVRDLSKQQSKQVELIIEGGETTADKRLLEEMKDSLMHMIRNAIDHGTETPEERQKLGKSPVAKIWLRGYQKANMIVVEVADDGRGLDLKKIKQTAIKRGLYRKEELTNMTPNQIQSLILAPGFSTRNFITEISGRGIGLDVVRTNVERLKGTIEIESSPGEGCTFRLQLGTTLATLNALLLEVQGIIHALPIEFVQTSLLVSQDEVYTHNNRESITFNDQPIYLANLADLLELSHSPAYAFTTKSDQHDSDLKPIIVLKVGEEQFGFFVDRLLDTQEVVIKPQSQLLKRIRNVSGATILATGEVCMILNPLDLLKSVQKQTTSVELIKSKETLKRKPVILLVEDSLPVRTQERRLLEGAGYEVAIAVDGLEGYNKLKTRDFDAVISDVEMPNLDGFSLTTKIRQHPEYDDLPIILVTTLDSDEDKKRGADAGADAYIIKGKFNQDFLLETLARLV